MTTSSSAGFATGAAATAAVGAAALWAATSTVAGGMSFWSAGGFAAMALPTIATGAWLAREHGRAGVSFVIALGTGLAIRAALLALVVAFAARRGGSGLTEALTGLAVGFATLMAFELAWFVRHTQAGSRPGWQR